MGYDMQSKCDSSEKGYFRLNIWGMGWMRNVMLEGDPTLEKDIYRFCSNDGHVVGEHLGKKIGAALRKFIAYHPIGTELPSQQATHEAATDQLAQMLAQHMGIEVMTPGRKENKTLTKEDIACILDFAEYNETQAPYEVF